MQVRDQVAAAKAVVYKATVNAKENGQPVQLRIEATLAAEHGTRMDTYLGEQLLGRSFTLADKKSNIHIFPEKKKYIEVALTEENRIENGDPKLIVESFLQGDYEKLGGARSTAAPLRVSSPRTFQPQPAFRAAED